MMITDWWLKQQDLVFSQFWRLEVQAQGVSRADCIGGLSLLGL